MKLVFSILLLALGGLVACSAEIDARAERGERSALLVSVSPVTLESAYTIERQFTGRVEARRASEPGFELGGQLIEVVVDEGDAIAAGDVLARLDTERLEARLAEAEAALLQARSARELNDKTLERSREAAAFEGISGQELDLAIDAANASVATVAAAEARVNSVRVDIRKSELRAPFDAIVVARRHDEGQIVAAGEPVLELQESARPTVRVGVSGDFSQGLEPGQTQLLTVDDRPLEATVDAVLPRRNPTTLTVDVLLRIDDDAALPGDVARLSLEQRAQESGFWLPVSALAEGSRGLWTAYVAKPMEAGEATSGGATHLLEPRPVEILYEATDRVYVRGALEEDDLYVSDGLTRVVPNQAVRLAESPRQSADVENRS